MRNKMDGKGIREREEYEIKTIYNIFPAKFFMGPFHYHIKTG
jgi:hypothetical protein